MEKKPEQIHSDNWLKDLPPVEVQTAHFKSEEMLVCPKCERRSPPNRLNCLYCSAELPVTDIQLIKSNLRRLENWEKGFNIIFLPGNSDFSEAKISEIAGFLQFENNDLHEIIACRKSLPIARVESEREAEIICKRLKEVDIESLIISDENLQSEIAPRRLRALEFTDDKLNLVLFNTVEIVELGREDLCLIVIGAAFERKIESSEKLNRRKENKILAATEINSDELLIDVYSCRDSIGFRIEANGFDFSCLGEEKHLLAGENMKRLVAKLRAFSGNVIFDEDYRSVRRQLSFVWELEEKRNSKGLQRKSFGSGLTLESTTTVDNLRQFTKYSRLQRHLL